MGSASKVSNRDVDEAKLRRISDAPFTTSRYTQLSSLITAPMHFWLESKANMCTTCSLLQVSDSEVRPR